MILVDTNVLSEPLKLEPDGKVVAWLRFQPRAGLFTSTVTQAEMLYGVRALPSGRRRDQLLTVVRSIFVEGFAGKVLAFDSDSAEMYAEIASARRAAGKPISQFDAMIAAIARSRGAVLATRNTADFEDCGVELTNPWTD